MDLEKLHGCETALRLVAYRRYVYLNLTQRCTVHPHSIRFRTAP
ncbi:DUF3156 family protein [Rosenbergiella epipactidis]